MIVPVESRKPIDHEASVHSRFSNILFVRQTPNVGFYSNIGRTYPLCPGEERFSWDGIAKSSNGRSKYVPYSGNGALLTGVSKRFVQVGDFKINHVRIDCSTAQSLPLRLLSCLMGESPSPPDRPSRAADSNLETSWY